MTAATPPLRVGIPAAFSLRELPPLIAGAWSRSAACLRDAGCELVSVPETRLSSRWIKPALASYYVLACAEASSNLSRYDGVRYGREPEPETFPSESLDDNAFGALSDMTALERRISATRVQGFGEEVQRRILAGTSVLSSDRFHTHYEAAAVVRARVSRALAGVLRFPSASDDDRSERVDVMLVPTALSFPCPLTPRHDEGTLAGMDPTAAFANDVMTIPISLAGLPAISVPVTADTGNGEEHAPIGMQIFAAQGAEEAVLSVADALQDGMQRFSDVGKSAILKG